jgi:mannose-1-phosphate guanylyltransferase
VPWDKVSSYGVVIADAGGRVISFQEKPRQEQALSNRASTGIYIFEPAVLNLIPSGEEFDIGSQLFPLMVEKGLPFFAQTCDFQWIDIGTVTDYWSVLQSLMRGEVEGMSPPGKEIAPGVWAGLNVKVDWEGTVIEGPEYIASGARIDAGVKIKGPTWIGQGSRVLSNAEVTRCVLFEYTRVSAKARLDELIVFKRYSVDRDGLISDERAVENTWGNARDRRATKRATTSLKLAG